MDHCSQGMSDRWASYPDRGWVRNFPDYAKDQIHFIKNITEMDDKDEKWLLGHSMGGLVSYHIVTSMPGYFDKILLSSPMLSIECPIKGLPDSAFRFLAFLVARVFQQTFEWTPGAGPKEDYHWPRGADNTNTSCDERIDCWDSQRKDNQQVVVGGVTWGWLYTSLEVRF